MQSKEEIKENKRNYYLKNRERFIQRNKDYYLNNKEKVLKLVKEYITKNKETINVKRKNYYHTNNEARLAHNLRSRVRHALRGKSRGASLLELTGMPIEHLKTYLEDRFQEGMSWNNYGKWHVDHIKPCAAFDLTLFEEQRKCFHYSNLQPLWAKDNISKHNKF